MSNPITADFAVINQLTRETSETLVRELLSEFCNGLPSRIDQCRQALRVDDLTLIARSAHVLRSEAETFGAMELGDTLQQLETASVSGQTSERINEIIDLAATLSNAYISAVRESQF